MNSTNVLSIALLDEEVRVADRLTHWIQENGHECDVFRSAEKFKQSFRYRRYAMVVLDCCQSPENVTLKILLWLRAIINSAIPVIVLTEQHTENALIAALNDGAVFLMNKPVNQVEFLSVVDELARQAHKKQEMLTYPPFVIDTKTRQIRLHNKIVKLTNKEYDCALFLFYNCGITVTRQQLLFSVWGTLADLQTRTVDVHISRLRKKLNLLSSERWSLMSIRDRGYRLEEIPVAVAGVEPSTV